jgi:hypothetical protein
MALESIPAPFQGWNTIDSIAEIPSNMALVLDNWIPSTASVISRKGMSVFATGVGSGNVDSLFELKAKSVNKFIAASSNSLYDISVSGSATLLASGFSSNQWQGAVFNAVLGLVNGVDAPQIYDGTTVSSMTVSGPSNINAINSMMVFKNRTYFTVINSQSFWYSALSTMGNVLTEFPLGEVGNFGGNLIAIQGLTNDGGNGQDDNLCFFMSTGEIIIYAGTDPGVDFNLIGVFYAGRPITTRGIIKYGPDILSITNNGYEPISSLLPLSFGKDNTGIGKYIKGAAAAATSASPSAFGWQATLAPNDNLLVINVPQTNNQFVQHVLNVNTTAWCSFSGINARCWSTFGNTLYCGGTNGTVYMYGPNYLDFGNTQYPQTYQPGYIALSQANQNFGQNTVRMVSGPSRTSAIRPRMRFDSAMTMTLSSSVDFKPFNPSYTVSYPSIGANWGDPWGSPWSVANSFINFLNFNTIGYSTTVKIVCKCSGAIDFYETNFLVQPSERI